MTNFYKTQTKGFAVFLILTILTAFYFSAVIDNAFIWGILVIFWGIFGFFRIIDLTYDEIKTVSKFLNLPLQILFGAERREQERRKLIVKRLSNPDVLFWLMGVMFYLSWVVYNGLMPAPINLKAMFNVPLALQFEQIESSVQFNLYAFLMGLSYVALLITIVFLAITYSQNRQHVQIGLIVLAPLFLVGVIKLWLAESTFIVTTPLWPDISFIKGYGFGASLNDILDANGVDTGFIKRFIGLGAIGAYGAYVLFIPALYMLGKTVFIKGRGTLRPLIGLGSLVTLVFLDVAVLSSGWVSYLSFILIVCAVLCWGSIVRYK